MKKTEQIATHTEKLVEIEKNIQHIREKGRGKIIIYVEHHEISGVETTDSTKWRVEY